jgi:hypothetical protein
MMQKQNLLLVGVQRDHNDLDGNYGLCARLLQKSNNLGNVVLFLEQTSAISRNPCKEGSFGANVKPLILDALGDTKFKVVTKRDVLKTLVNGKKFYMGGSLIDTGGLDVTVIDELYPKGGALKRVPCVEVFGVGGDPTWEVKKGSLDQGLLPDFPEGLSQMALVSAEGVPLRSGHQGGEYLLREVFYQSVKGSFPVDTYGRIWDSFGQVDPLSRVHVQSSSDYQERESMMSGSLVKGPPGHIKGSGEGGRGMFQFFGPNHLQVLVNEKGDLRWLKREDGFFLCSKRYLGGKVPIGVLKDVLAPHVRKARVDTSYQLPGDEHMEVMWSGHVKIPFQTQHAWLEVTFLKCEFAGEPTRDGWGEVGILSSYL